jgi:hypothetical protein
MQIQDRTGQEALDEERVGRKKRDEEDKHELKESERERVRLRQRWVIKEIVKIVERTSNRNDK